MKDPEGYFDLKIDRSDEAKEIAEFIRSSEQKLLVLHARRGSGKTELIKTEVIPVLRLVANAEVFYGVCAANFPVCLQGIEGDEDFEAVTPRVSIVFIDNFDSVLNLPRKKQGDVLENMFSIVNADNVRAKFVLVLDTRQLASMYALSSYAPGIMDAVLELGSVGVEDGLANLSKAKGSEGTSYSAKVLKALSEQAQSFEGHGRGVTFDLLKVLDFHFRRRLGSEQRTVEVSDLPSGGMRGVLRDYLELKIDELAEKKQAHGDIAIAILQHVVTAQTEGAAIDLAEIPPRLDVSNETFKAALSQTKGQAGLLREIGEDQFELVPNELTEIVEEDMSALQNKNERAYRLVEEGFRSWEEDGDLLPLRRFEEIHARRKDLELAEKYVQFLLRCAIYCGSRTDHDAGRYWLRRIREQSDVADIFLASSFDAESDVRFRAAGLMSECEESAVRSRLLALALQDEEPRVRERAISSLEGKENDYMMKLVRREATSPDSPYRVAAVDALRVFKTKEAVNVLQGLVNDPQTELQLREKAIEVLAALEIPESIDSLIDIGLEDDDEEDRENAAKALALTQSESLNRQALSRLQVPDRWIGRYLTGALLPIIAISVIGILLSSNILGISILAVVLLLLPLTRALTLQLQDRTIELASFRGFVAIVLFAVSTVTVFAAFHGLAHAITKRKLQGLYLFGLEVLGVTLIVIGSMFIDQPGDVEQGMALGYWIVGALLFWGSYFYDVVTVLFELFVFARTNRARRRIALMHESIVTNCGAAKLVFDGLKSKNKDDVRWAKRLLDAFGKRIDSNQLINQLKKQEKTSLPYVIRSLKEAKDDRTVDKLEVLWNEESENAALRGSIAKILRQNPNERSLEVLARTRPQMGLPQKLGSSLAGGHFIFKVWPKPVKIGVLMALPLIGYFSYDAAKTVNNPVWPLIKEMQRPLWSWEADTPQEESMAKIVGFLAENYPEKSETYLLQRFEEHKSSFQILYATMAKGLIVIADGKTVKDKERILDALTNDKSLSFLRKKLQEPIDAGEEDFENGLAVFRFLAKQEEHEQHAQKAVDKLQDFVTESDDAALANRRLKVIEELFALQSDSSRQALSAILTDEALVSFLAAEGDDIFSKALAILQRLSSQEEYGELAQEAVDELQDFVLKRDDAALFSRRLKVIEALFAVQTDRSHKALQTTLTNDASLSFLTEPGDAAFAEALQVFLIMAKQERDGDVAQSAVNLFQNFVLESVGDATKVGESEQYDRLHDVIEALGGIQNDRSREALETIRSSKTEINDALARDVDRFISNSSERVDQKNRLRVLKNNFKNGEFDTVIREGLELLDDVRDSATKTELIALIGKAYYRNQQYLSAMEFLEWSVELDPEDEDVNNLLERVEAFSEIAGYPSDSWGYEFLWESSYQDDQQALKESVNFLQQIRDRHPELAMPRLYLAFFYHEFLSKTDLSSYRSAYEEVKSLSSDEEIYIRANVLEIALSAREYKQVIVDGRSLLEETEDDFVFLHVNLLMYAAALLQNDFKSADDQLNALRQVSEALPSNFYNNAEYAGTLRFVSQTDLHDEIKQALVSMFKDGAWDDSDRRKQLIESNQNALRAVMRQGNVSN